jgi:hypothetical protein
LNINFLKHAVSVTAYSQYLNLQHLFLETRENQRYVVLLQALMKQPDDIFARGIRIVDAIAYIQHIFELGRHGLQRSILEKAIWKKTDIHRSVVLALSKCFSPVAVSGLYAPRSATR